MLLSAFVAMGLFAFDSRFILMRISILLIMIMYSKSLIASKEHITSMSLKISLTFDYKSC